MKTYESMFSSVERGYLLCHFPIVCFFHLNGPRAITTTRTTNSISTTPPIGREVVELTTSSYLAACLRRRRRRRRSHSSSDNVSISKGVPRGFISGGANHSERMNEYG